MAGVLSLADAAGGRGARPPDAGAAGGRGDARGRAPEAEVPASWSRRRHRRGERAGRGRRIRGGRCRRAVETVWSGRGARTKRLTVTHAFHRALMEPILDEFGAALAGVEFRPPLFPIVSNLTGELAGDEVPGRTTGCGTCGRRSGSPMACATP